MQKFPLLFIGHGSPMNAIQKNPFTQKLAELGKILPRPKAILCISAHWLTKGTWVTRMREPKTIHDFYGFPKELFAIQYLAPGSPEIADLIRSEVKNPKINSDEQHWGLDHGTWSILLHMYPNADIPVLQLSIDMDQPPEYHFNLGEQLRSLREKEILILGSGNIVHNLRTIDFSSNAKPFDWAIEFDDWVKQKLLEKNYSALVSEATNSKIGKLSIPTNDHWYPLLYILGASAKDETLQFEYEGIEHASISMRSFSLGIGCLR